MNAKHPVEQSRLPPSEYLSWSSHHHASQATSLSASFGLKRNRRARTPSTVQKIPVAVPTRPAMKAAAMFIGLNGLVKTRAPNSNPDFAGARPSDMLSEHQTSHGYCMLEIPAHSTQCADKAADGHKWPSANDRSQPDWSSVGALQRSGPSCLHTRVDALIIAPYC